MTDCEKVENVASMIREEITKYKSPYSVYPPVAEEIKYENVVVPKLLEVLLKSLTKDTSLSSQITRLVKSIAQDIIYNSTRGKIKTVKHVQLGLFTKRQTGSKVLDCLNRLGHSISYHEINNIETTFADVQIRNQCHQSYVPNNVQPSVFTTFVYDNCDHNPESLTGVSMHCMNGIIIQRGYHVSTGPTDTAVAISSSKRRSFSPVTSELEPYIQRQKKQNPPMLKRIEQDINYFDGFVSRKSDFVWLLSRLVASQNEKQIVPSWTGFYYETSSQNLNERHSIHYLPAINQSPTKFDTVQEILVQVKKKSESLGLVSADLVMDHAIYTKALEVMVNPINQDLHNFINLHMGGFHACCIFLAVIAKRFSAAGLKDVIIETNLVGPGAVESVLKGKQYNRGIRVVKIL